MMSTLGHLDTSTKSLSPLSTLLNHANLGTLQRPQHNRLQTNKNDCQKAPSRPFNLQLFAQPLSICLYQILLYRDYTTFPTLPSL